MRHVAMGRQERRQVARDRRVGRIGQAELLEARRRLARLVVERDAGQEPVDQQLADFVARRLRPAARRRSASRPPPGRLTVSRSGASLPSSVSLTCWQMRTSTAHWPRLELAVAGQPLFEVMGQGQVEVVAAEDQVIADGDAVELDLAAFAAADADQREVGRAAADVADQDLLARLRPAAPSRRRGRRSRRRRPPAAPRSARRAAARPGRPP